MEQPSECNAYPQRALVVGAQAVSLLGVASLLRDLKLAESCRLASTLEEALTEVAEFQPGLIVLDGSNPRNWTSRLRELLLQEYPHIPLLVTSSQCEAVAALHLISSGVRGYFSKCLPLDEFAVAVRTVAEGGVYVPQSLRGSRVFRSVFDGDRTYIDQMRALSPREAEVFTCLAQAMSTAECAEALGISVKTVETHRVHLKEKLGFLLAEDLVDFAREWAAAQTLLSNLPDSFGCTKSPATTLGPVA